MILLATAWYERWYYVCGGMVGFVALCGIVFAAARWLRRVGRLMDVLIGVRGGAGVRATEPLVDIVDAHTKTLEGVMVDINDIKTQLTGRNGKTLREDIEIIKDEQRRVRVELAKKGRL
jgi:hypothetical protein